MVWHLDARQARTAGVRQGWKHALLAASILLSVTTGVVVAPGIAQAATGVSNVAVECVAPDLGRGRADHLRGQLHHLVDRRP